MLLETHPQITPCVYADMAAKSGLVKRHIGMRYLMNQASLDDWKKTILEELEKRQDELSRRQSEQFGEFKIAIPPKENVRYLFYHDHIHQGFFGRLTNSEFVVPQDRFNTIQTVVTLRDPLLSVISALRRTNEGMLNAARILKGLEYVSKLTCCHFFCVDLKSYQPLEIFSKLNLSPVEASGDYILLSPVINKTFSESDLKHSQRFHFFSHLKKNESRVQSTSENTSVHSYSPPVPSDELKRLREAKDWLGKKKLHPILKPWAKILRANPVFEEFYKRVGYQDLIWFK